MEIYLDNAATTQPLPEVVKAMRPYCSEEYGNASTIYSIGRRARHALDEARDSVAGVLGVRSGEVSFCSGASESICLNLIGAALAIDEGRRRFVTSSIEHKAVLKTANWLMENLGWDVTLVDPEPSGHINPDKFVEACSNGCGSASLQWVNNEIGTIQPIEEVASRLKSLGVIMHADVVQGIGKMPIDLGASGIDIISASGHKFYGPKGSGLTFMREGVEIRKVLVGGGQELDRRAGTENTAGSIGLATALEIVAKNRNDFVTRLRELKVLFLDELNASGVEYHINGEEPMAAGLVNIYFPGVESESLLLHADRAGICISTGSACAAGSIEPSFVITSLGMNRVRGLSSIRVSIGWHNTADEVTEAGKTIAEIAAKLRGST